MPRSGSLAFEAKYRADPDPHRYTNPDERVRYERMLEALGDRRSRDALEIGCSIGVFTAMLAPRCDRLVAVDVAEAALEHARTRLGGAVGRHRIEVYERR